MANINVSGSISKVLEGLAGDIRAAAKKAVWNIGDEAYEELLNPMDEGGISPKDEYRYTYGKNSKNRYKDTIRSKWSFRTREYGDTVGIELRNQHPAAETMYGNLDSEGHPNGFRSAYPHVPVVYTVNGTKVILHRKNQLTEAKWVNWFVDFQAKLGNEIIVETRKKR